MKSGEHKKLVYIDGKYFVDIDITAQEWKEMLLDDNIFDSPSKEMILQWYYQPDHLATSKKLY